MSKVDVSQFLHLRFPMLDYLEGGKLGASSGKEDND
jgi:hypothetical protein